MEMGTTGELAPRPAQLIVPLSTLTVSGKKDFGAIQAELENRGVQFVRLLWIDAAGIRRVRVVPTARFAAACASGVGLSYAAHWLPSWGDSPPQDPVAVPVGEVRLLPDLSTLRLLPWHPAHAAVAVRLAVQPPDSIWTCCPRAALARVVWQLAEKEHGLSVRVGYETEFVLLQKPEAGNSPQAPPAASAPAVPPALDRSVYCQSSSYDGAASVMDDICNTLAALGIGVEQAHPESGGGQFEVATAPSTPLQAADNLLFTKEAITAVAARNNLTASFLPKLGPQTPANGLHLHLSLWRGDTNLLQHDSGAAAPGGTSASSRGMGSWGFRQEGEAFLAGILHHLPALMVFTAPTPNSYRRLLPGHWAGAFRCWGFNNREAPLRLCPGSPGEEGGGSNVEFKTHDGTANPYLALAAIIVAGLEGIQAGLTLPPPVHLDPGTLPADKLAAAGIERLPKTLSEALEAFEKDESFHLALNAAFGTPDLVRAFLAVRKSEDDVWGCKSVLQEATSLYARY